MCVYCDFRTTKAVKELTEEVLCTIIYLHFMKIAKAKCLLKTLADLILHFNHRDLHRME